MKWKMKQPSHMPMPRFELRCLRSVTNSSPVRLRRLIKEGYIKAIIIRLWGYRKVRQTQCIKLRCSKHYINQQQVWLVSEFTLLIPMLFDYKKKKITIWFCNKNWVSASVYTVLSNLNCYYQNINPVHYYYIMCVWVCLCVCAQVHSCTCVCVFIHFTYV